MRRAALLVLLLGLAVPAPAHAAFPGANGKIVYTFGHEAIYTINPDGTGQTKIAPQGVYADPAWSPNGRKIAFATGSGIFVMNADGSGIVRLSNDLDFHPSWSPDGTKIVFHAIRDAPLRLYVMNADGSDLRPLGNPPFLGDDPAWSPDGTKIAFEGFTGIPDGRQRSNVSTVNPDGTGLINLTPDLDHALMPEWSPDGKRIAFVGPGLGTLPSDDLYTMNPDGTGRVRLTNTANIEFNPAWSPDGTKIAYVVRRYYGGFEDDLEIVNADGSGLFRLTFGGGDHNGEPDWQPIPGPQRSDYKNAALFCKAEHDFLGEDAFAAKYGANDNDANAYGKCVSQNH